MCKKIKKNTYFLFIKNFIVLTNDYGRKRTVAKVKHVCDLNYRSFVLFYWRVIYLLFGSALKDIDQSNTNPFFIQLRRIIKFRRNFLYLLTVGCSFKGKLTGPFPYWRLLIASTRNRSTRVSTKSSRWLIYFHIYSSLSVHHLLHHPSNSPHVRVCVWSKWTTFNCSHFK